MLCGDATKKKTVLIIKNLHQSSSSTKNSEEIDIERKVKRRKSSVKVLVKPHKGLPIKCCNYKMGGVISARREVYKARKEREKEKFKEMCREQEKEFEAKQKVVAEKKTKAK